ncbi:MAG: ubiquinone biosynthesis protein UbiB, partial [Sphingomonadales bacterium CG12_big_fil_rev_8_21_14_0_65_65_10]
RLEEQYPPKGGAPEPPPLPEVELVWERSREPRRWPGYLLAGAAGIAVAWLAAAQGWIG